MEKYPRRYSRRFEPAVIMCKNVYYDNIDKKYYCTQHTEGFRVPKHCRCCQSLKLEHTYEYRRVDNGQR